MFARILAPRETAASVLFVNCGLYYKFTTRSRRVLRISHYHAYSTTDSPYSGKSISFAHCCLNFAVLAEYCTDPFSHAPAEVGWSGTCAMLADYY